jgi:hypothetical protein
MLRILAAIMLLLGGVTAAPMARADGLSGVYFGGSAGRARASYDTSLFEEQLKAEAAAGFQTLTFTQSVLRKRSNAWWAYAGYMRWSYVGIEASYLHLGELTYWSAGTLTPPDQALSESTTVRSSGPALALLFRVPISEGFDFNVRIGDYYGKRTVLNSYELNSTVTPQTQSTSTSSLLLGVGAAYTFGAHVSTRFDYLRVNQASGTSIG